MKTLNKYENEFKANGLGALLEMLANDGYCPNLLNDDNGCWALTFQGYQSLRLKKTDDLQTSFMVDAKYWKKDITKAVQFTLKEF